MKWYQDKGLLSFCLLVAVCMLGLAILAYISLGDPAVTINCIGNCWDE